MRDTKKSKRPVYWGDELAPKAKGCKHKRTFVHREDIGYGIASCWEACSHCRVILCAHYVKDPVIW